MLIQNGGVRNADLGTFEVRVGELPAFAAIGKGSEIGSGGLSAFIFQVLGL